MDWMWANTVLGSTKNKTCTPWAGTVYNHVVWIPLWWALYTYITQGSNWSSVSLSLYSSVVRALDWDLVSHYFKSYCPMLMPGRTCYLSYETVMLMIPWKMLWSWERELEIFRYWGTVPYPLTVVQWVSSQLRLLVWCQPCFGSLSHTTSELLQVHTHK